MTENEHKRLENIRAKMAQLKTQERAIIARDNKHQRKQRTRHLIQCGELVEKYFGISNIEPTEFEVFLQLFLEVKNIKAHADIIKKSLNL